jgi:hypothetical protein
LDEISPSGLRPFSAAGATHVRTENAADFAAGSKALEYFTSLRGIITQLETTEATQKGGSAAPKEVLLDSLRLDTQNIARTARAIDQDEPGFAVRFPAPAAHNQAAVLSAASNILEELLPVAGEPAEAAARKAATKAKFVEHELPETFVADLKSARDAVIEAMSRQEADRIEGVSSTVGVGELVAEGVKLVNCLNAAMHNKYSRNPREAAGMEERQPHGARSATHGTGAHARPEPGAFGVKGLSGVAGAPKW